MVRTPERHPWVVALICILAGVVLTGFRPVVHVPIEDGQAVAFNVVTRWHGLPVFDAWVTTLRDADILLLAWQVPFYLGALAYAPAAAIALRAVWALARRPPPAN